MNFSHKGFKFGLSAIGGEFFFYSQKMIDKNKPQQKLKAKTLNRAIKEVQELIEKQIK